MAKDIVTITMISSPTGHSYGPIKLWPNIVIMMMISSPAVGPAAAMACVAAAYIVMAVYSYGRT